MAYFWFQVDGESGTFEIDTNAIDVTLPSLDRRFERIPQARDGSYVKGAGWVSPGELTFTRKFSAGAYAVAWNSLRNQVMRWMGTTRYKTLWFYVMDSDGVTYRNRVYPLGTGGERYASLRVSDPVTFTFMAKEGYWENTTATTISATTTSASLELINVTNDGVFPAPPLFTFTAGASFSLMQASLGDGYGFRIESTWSSGDIVTYNCADGVTTVNGNQVSGLLSEGSMFYLPPGESTIYFYGTSGTLDISFNERVL